MPEEQSLKRSRSPSEAEPTANKRPNNKSSPKDDADDTPAPSSRHANKSDTAEGGATAANSGDSTMEDSASATATGEDAQKANPDLPAPVTSSSPAASVVPAAQIHLRCLIVTQDASIIIGKGGSHVNEIRDKSGARVMVSESIPGNPERILNVSGALDAVSKVNSSETFSRHSGSSPLVPSRPLA